MCKIIFKSTQIQKMNLLCSIMLNVNQKPLCIIHILLEAGSKQRFLK